MNQQTAAYNKALNLNNYSNPFGSQTSSISGYDPQSGAPIYQTNTTANPLLSGNLNQLLGQIWNSQYNTSQNISGINDLNSQLGGINSQIAGLGNSISPEQAQLAQQQGQNAAYAAQSQYLDPQFNQRQESLNAQLAAQGLAPGSQAYNNAMTNFNNERQQAYSNAQNQSILTGSQLGTQNLQNQLAGLSAKSGLLNQQAQNLGQMGSFIGQNAQLSQLPYQQLQSIAGLIPGYTGPSGSAANSVDFAGLANNAYQGQLGAYNAKQQANNQTMSTLGTVAGIGAALFL